jgi:hypothetical protein
MVSVDRGRIAIRFVQLTPEILRAAQLRSRDAEFYAAMIANDAAAAALSQPGYGWAMLDRERLLGVGGVVTMWMGRGLLWLAPGPDARPRHFATVLALVKEWITDLLRRGEFRRLEANIRADCPEAILWARRVGLTCETHMYRFMPDGADAFLYAMTDRDVLASACRDLAAHQPNSRARSEPEQLPAFGGRQ